MSGRPLAVADTNVLLNLATPVVDASERAPSGGDPLRAFLSAYDVHVPGVVLGEVAETSENGDLLAAAGGAVLEAAHHLTTHDVDAALDEALEYGLDPGEAHSIWLANHLAADLFVTDEFGSGTHVLVALELDDSNVLSTTPQLLCHLAERGVLDGAYADEALTYLRDLKQWDRSYVERLREKYR